MNAKHESRLSSVGTHFALTTTVVLVFVLAVVFAELTAREHTRSLAARQSAAEIVTVLFANSSSAALVFDDSDGLQKEIANVQATPGVVGAALFRAGEVEPAAASPTAGACVALDAGAAAMGQDWVAVSQRIVSQQGNVVGKACVIFSLDEENRAFQATRLRMAVRGLITAVAIAVLLMIVSRRKVIRPLMNLVDVAAAIERGEARASATVGSTDEIGQLARAFNRMGEAVADREGRLRAELETAARLQVSILPRTPIVPGLEIAAQMDTATEVGGDYYDVIPTPHGCWLGIGDVSGHGLGAGVVMLMIQSAVGALVRANPDASPRVVECIVNRLVHENVRLRMGRRDHATLTLLRYEESGLVRLAGAHEDILVFRSATGEVERIETHGTWVGVIPAIEHATEESSFQLEIGDVMVLYTDGLTEAFRNREQFGLERLVEALRTRGTRGVDEIRDGIVSEVNAWEDGSPRSDDMSIVVLRHVGRGVLRATAEMAATAAAASGA